MSCCVTSRRLLACVDRERIGSISNDFRPSVRSNRRALGPPKRCIGALLRFILPAIEQIRSNPVTPTRLRDVPALISNSAV
jgi:hypothetical protein